MMFVSGEWQHVQSLTGESRPARTSKDSYGGAGGVRADFSGLSLVGSGFYGKGIGTVLMFDSGNEVDGAGELRNVVRLHRSGRVPAGRHEVEVRRELWRERPEADERR